MSLLRMLSLAATIMIAAAFVWVTLSTAAIAADPAPRYRLEQGRFFGYAALLEVQQAGRTEYHVGFPLFAVSATANRQATAVLAFGLEQVKSPEAMPSKPAEFHTEKISLQGGNYSLNEERRSFRYLPGSFVDQIFTPLPDGRSESHWGDSEPFTVLGSTDRGHQDSKFELIDSTWRFRETFVRHIKSKDGTPKEEWRGAGEVQFDLQRGLISSRDFTLVYSKPPGDVRSQVHVKLSLRLLDGAALRHAAQATAVRLPGEAFLSQEKGQISAVAGSGRWAHADTSFYDTQKLFAAHEGGVYRAQIVGEAQRGQLCYRLTGSRAFWDGYLPAEKFQFIPGEINPNGGNVAMIHDDQRARLLADLQGGEVQRAAKAIEQLAGLRPHQPDDEMATALVTWIGVTERHLANDFSDAMQHWATLAAAPSLIELLGMPDGVVRRIADAGLTGIGAPAEGEVARHLQHPNLETRERMLSLLGRIGTAQSLPALGAIEEQGADKKIRQAANFAAVQIRERHGLKSPMASDMEDRLREFERDREKWRADFDRKRQQADEDFRRRVEEQRRKAEANRKKFEADSRARRAAKR